MNVLKLCLSYEAQTLKKFMLQTPSPPSEIGLLVNDMMPGGIYPFVYHPTNKHLAWPEMEINAYHRNFVVRCLQSSSNFFDSVGNQPHQMQDLCYLPKRFMLCPNSSEATDCSLVPVQQTRVL